MGSRQMVPGAGEHDQILEVGAEGVGGERAIQGSHVGRDLSQHVTAAMLGM
jgi:hypothetical protein